MDILSIYITFTIVFKAGGLNISVPALISGAEAAVAKDNAKRPVPRAISRTTLFRDVPLKKTDFFGIALPDILVGLTVVHRYIPSPLINTVR
jgi:hypothetical protein